MDVSQAEEGSQLIASTAEKDHHQGGMYSWKVVKSLTIIISEIILGISMTLLSAVLHDLNIQLGMSYTELSIANSMASVGAILGSVVGGLLTKKLGDHLDPVLIVVHLMNTVALLSIPFTDSLVLQSVEWFMQGLAMAAGLVVNCMVAVHIWPGNVGPVVLFMAACNSVGHTMGPLIAMPFVLQENTDNSSSPLIYVLFAILAGLFVANAVNLLIQHAIGLRCHRCYDSASISDTKQGSSEPKRTSHLLWLVVPGMGIVDFFVRASDNIPAYLIPSIGIESHLRMPASRSDLVLVLYNINRTISKLVSSFLLKRVSVMLCLPICLVMTTVLALFLFLMGLNSVPSFFIIVITMGLFTGPTAALLMVWVNEYVAVDGYALSVWQVAENIGILSSVLVGGIVFDFYGSLPSLFVNLIDGIIACITFCILHFLIATSNKIS